MIYKTETLMSKKLANAPKWMKNNIFYECLMGSVSYGCSTDNSDIDIYGWCIPPKEMVFPHLKGEIPGFGNQIKKFEQYQEHHIDTKDGTDKIYDISIYNIVKYFQLCMENNPNMIDSLFVPDECVINITRVGQMVRDERRSFLHKGSWHKFKGYAYSQMHKVRNKNPEGKRKELIEKFGYDVKYAAHCVRLMDEAEQILATGDINLRKNSEQLKAIRRGDCKLEDIEKIFANKELELEKLYISTNVVPMYPDENKIKSLLLKCLEDHYGSLSKAVVLEGREKQALDKIRAIMDEYYGQH